MEHMTLQASTANAAHEQHYFTPAPRTAFLATHQDLAASSAHEFAPTNAVLESAQAVLASEQAESVAAERLSAARARMAQATQVRAAQKAYLQDRTQDFSAWLAQTPFCTNEVTDDQRADDLSAEHAPSNAELQLKDELLTKLSTFPPKAPQITCACKCLRSHRITLVPKEQQERAHKRTEEEQLSCDYLALVLTYLKPAERPSFYNTCLSSITALHGLTSTQLMAKEQAAEHYEPTTLRTWAKEFTGTPSAQLTRPWDLSDLSHFECCDYELPQHPKAYDVTRTCLALSERAQCVTLETQAAINDLHLCLKRLQPRHLGTLLSKINPLLKCDGPGFIQGLVALGRSIAQHFPLVALMAPGITPPDPTDPTQPQITLEEQVKAFLKSTEPKLKGKLLKQAERNDAQYQRELEQVATQAHSSALSSTHNDSTDHSVAENDLSADHSTHDWYVPQLPQSPFGAVQSDDEASSADHSPHDWYATAAEVAFWRGSVRR